jgi:hypothetical protein
MALDGVRVRTAGGEEIALGMFAGRPLLVVCVRYYG